MTKRLWKTTLGVIAGLGLLLGSALYVDDALAQGRGVGPIRMLANWLAELSRIEDEAATTLKEIKVTLDQVSDSIKFQDWNLFQLECCDETDGVFKPFYLADGPTSTPLGSKGITLLVKVGGDCGLQLAGTSFAPGGTLIPGSGEIPPGSEIDLKPAELTYESGDHLIKHIPNVKELYMGCFGPGPGYCSVRIMEFTAPWFV